MRTVYLLRHAKSDWADAELSDHERPLNARGREAAPQMAAYMRAHRYRPDLVLSSTATRTRETLTLVAGVLGDLKTTFDERLYLAEPHTLFDRLRSVTDDVQAVMLVGHNPGIAQFALQLSAAPADEGEEKLHRRMRDKFSTCALAVIRTAVKTWREVKPGAGKLKDFMRPKDL